jgi:hypothetical protein
MTQLTNNHILVAALALVEEKLQAALKEIESSKQNPADVVSIVESVVDHKLKSMPDIGTMLEGVSKEIDEKSSTSSKFYAKVYNELYSELQTKQLNEAIETHHHDDQYAPKVAFEEHHHDDQYAPMDAFETHVGTTNAAIATTNSQTNQKIHTLGHAVVGELDALHGKLAEVDKKHTDANQESIETTIRLNKVGVDSLAEEAKKIRDEHAQGMTKVDKAVTDLKSQLDMTKANHKDFSEKSKKSIKELTTNLSNHTHDFAATNHSHPEYLTEAHMRALNDNISSVDREHSNSIETLSKALSTKADDTAVLKSTDIDSIKDAVTKTIQDSIKIPKDGLGWEFKQHPQRKGTLMLKREDKKTWENVVLFNDSIINEMMSAINNMHRQPNQSFIGGGGAAYQDPREIISQGSLNDLMDVDTKTLQPTSNDIFMWDALSNQWVPRTMQDLAALIIPILENDMQKQYNKLVDQIDPSTMYIGEAIPGAATSAAEWRIKKITESPSGDISILWADSTADFVNTWDARLTYTYSI